VIYVGNGGATRTTNLMANRCGGGPKSVVAWPENLWTSGCVVLRMEKTHEQCCDL